MNKRNESIIKVSIVIFVVIAITAAFLWFSQWNRETVEKQCVSQIQEATLQKTYRTNDILEEKLRAVSSLAYLYGNALHNGVNESDLFKELGGNTLFDDVIFVGEDAIGYNKNGVVTHFSDTSCYIEGIKGNYGILEVSMEEEYGGNIIAVYTPTYNGHKIVGVTVGLLSREYMEEVLESNFYGTKAEVFLCDSDGHVIAQSSKIQQIDNINLLQEEGIIISDTDTGNIKGALQRENDIGFEYECEGETSVAYAAKIEMKNWYIVQLFPHETATVMFEEANIAGLLLEIMLVVVFLIYISYILIRNYRQKKILKIMNRDANYVANATSRIFGKFVMVDLETDKYCYLHNQNPENNDIPRSGDYKVLVEHIVAMIMNKEEKDQIKKVLDKEQLQINLNNENRIYSFGYRVLRGEEKWESLHMICLEEKKGVPLKVLLARQDVTQVKEQEIRNQHALEEAFRAAENANMAKDNFLSHMSHDIRTPLNAITGMTAIAEMNIDKPERVKDCLEKISVSGKHLNGLVNEVLEMSKIESGQTVLAEESFVLSELTDNLMSIMNGRIEEKNLEINVYTSNITHEYVVGDRQRLEQILINIVGNAVKFTPENGHINILFSEKDVSVPGYGCYEIICEDTGIGMSQETLNHIFEPFYRAKDSTGNKIEGTGLGMPIVKNIVGMMRGEIAVESSLGKGSKFTVVVYLKLDNSKVKNEFERLEGLSVLVVDESKEECKTAVEILGALKMDVACVNDGQSALDILKRMNDKNKKVHAVIVGLKMQGMNGIETAKEIRALMGDNTPPIIMCAYDKAESEEMSKGIQVDGFLSKPLYKTKLINVFNEVLFGEKEQTNELKVESDFAGYRVLLVEDNQLNEEIAKTMIEMTGAEVEVARDGIEAVERLYQQKDEKIDLVFMDIQMPRMNGYEAVANIRNSGIEYLKRVPIIAMTADAFIEDERKARRAGMNGYIAKPIDLNKIIECLNTWLS